MSSVKDNFKGTEQASYYAKYRPVYPPTVLQNILDYLSSSEVDKRYKLAVDVGCGSGQATLPLCQYFESVIGVDISENQIEEARLKVGQGHVQGQGNVTFRVGDAEDLSFLPDNSVDLITIATAIFWFDLKKFSVECHRVLRPGGVLAAYSYEIDNFLGADGQPLDEINELHRQVMYSETGRLIPRHYFDSASQIFAIFQSVFSHTESADSIIMVNKYSVEEFQGFLNSMIPYWLTREKYPDKPDPVDTIGDCLLQVYNNNPPQDAVTTYNEVVMVMAKK